MPSIAAVSKIELPHKITQQEVKEQAHIMFSKDFPQTNRLIFAFDNTEIITRNFCKPLSFYTSTTTFEARARRKYSSRSTIEMRARVL